MNILIILFLLAVLGFLLIKKESQNIVRWIIISAFFSSWTYIEPWFKDMVESQGQAYDWWANFVGHVSLAAAGTLIAWAITRRKKSAVIQEVP